MLYYTLSKLETVWHDVTSQSCNLFFLVGFKSVGGSFPALCYFIFFWHCFKERGPGKQFSVTELSSISTSTSISSISKQLPTLRKINWTHAPDTRKSRGSECVNWIYFELTVIGFPCSDWIMKFDTTLPSFICIRGPKVLKIRAIRIETRS